MKYNFVGIEKLSLVDYEGKMCATLFSNGCNFKCPFCHNYSIVVDESLKPLDFEEVLSYLKKRQGILDAVCLSGGEITLLSDLEERIKQIRELGYLIKLDTNGSNPKMLKHLVNNKLVDYVAMDIKNCLKRYNETIGNQTFNLNNILESISFLMQNNIDFEFRTTLVSEFHNEDDIVQMGELIKGSKVLYLQHFVDSGTCIKQGLHDVPKDKALEYKEILENYVQKVNLRGYK